jgi:hypothetical protein
MCEFQARTAPTAFHQLQVASSATTPTVEAACCYSPHLQHFEMHEPTSSIHASSATTPAHNHNKVTRIRVTSPFHIKPFATFSVCAPPAPLVLAPRFTSPCPHKPPPGVKPSSNVHQVDQQSKQLQPNRSRSRSKNPDTRDPVTCLKLLLSGAMSAVVSRTAVAPLERVKMELLLGTSSKGALTTARTVLQYEGLTGFWKGNALNVLRTAPFKVSSITRSSGCVRGVQCFDTHIYTYTHNGCVASPATYTRAFASAATEQVHTLYVHCATLRMMHAMHCAIHLDPCLRV